MSTINSFTLRIIQAHSFASVLILLSACTHVQTEKELAEYVGDDSNGLTKEVTSNGISLQVSYHPTYLLVARELRSIANPTADQVENARKKYSTHHYFILSLSRQGREIVTPQEQDLGYGQLVQTLSFHMQQYVRLTTSNQDTLRIFDHVYDRTFGHSSGSKLLFVAERMDDLSRSPGSYIDFNIDEFGLRTGPVAARFNIDDIRRVPQIPFKTTTPHLPTPIKLGSTEKDTQDPTTTTMQK